ncbi:hypothetical protein ACFOET_03200 [Parapedobacter deserti]|uniref:Uncharacterized protein n=1 Tax=Parapedobacter deserti TaxID=1912957 RepID=A0ABV7JES1_9SPHI
MQLSKPSLVTYQVLVHDGASVSAVTYQTTKGEVSIDAPPIPFEVTVQMEKGDTVKLVAEGNPKTGNIVLTYQVQEVNTSDATVLSSSLSRVWIMKDGTCQ